MKNVLKKAIKKTIVITKDHRKIVGDATNIADIRNDLLLVFNGLMRGEIKQKDVAETINAAGKIFSSVKVQLAYHAMRKEAPYIAFLDDSMQSSKVIGNKKRSL